MPACIEYCLLTDVLSLFEKSSAYWFVFFTTSHHQLQDALEVGLATQALVHDDFAICRNVKCVLRPAVDDDFVITLPLSNILSIYSLSQV